MLILEVVPDLDSKPLLLGVTLMETDMELTLPLLLEEPLMELPNKLVLLQSKFYLILEVDLTLELLLELNSLLKMDLERKLLPSTFFFFLK